MCGILRKKEVIAYFNQGKENFRVDQKKRMHGRKIEVRRRGRARQRESLHQSASGQIGTDAMKAANIENATSLIEKRLVVAAVMS
jgi:hypothetical protein